MIDGPFRSKAALSWQPLTVEERLELSFGKLMPFRGVFKECGICDTKYRDGLSRTYERSGGTAGEPCKVIISRRWWGKAVRCMDPRPHIHVECNFCHVRYKMRAVGTDGA